jgi:chromosome segregation ATPase
VTRQGEETIGKLAQELLENPMVTGALSRALETRERAMRAQEVALGALNLPSASDLERLTRRLRAVSQRLEGVEDVLDRLEQGVDALDRDPVERRLAGIERSVERIETTLAELSAAVSGGSDASGASSAGPEDGEAASTPRPAATSR